MTSGLKISDRIVVVGLIRDLTPMFSVAHARLFTAPAVRLSTSGFVDKELKKHVASFLFITHGYYSCLLILLYPTVVVLSDMICKSYMCCAPKNLA